LPELATDFQSLPEEYQHLIRLAEQTHRIMRIEGLLVSGYIVAFRDDPQLGLERIETGISLYNSHRQRARRFGIGSNPGVIGLSVSALFLWMRGYPDRAYNRGANSIVLAQRLNHPYSLVHAQFHNGLLNMWLMNYEIARESARAVLELAEAHGFHIWNAVGSCLLGAASVNTGDVDRGLVLIEQGMTAYRGLKTPPVFWPILLHLCAGAYGAASRPEDGLPLLNEAIDAASSSSSSPRTLTSEFLILTGDILMASSFDNEVDAESLYQDAVNMAREVHASMLELRAAIRLSRLWHNQGSSEQARELLRIAYSKITEGFSTADMKEAKALLATLSS
jgi:predicted ATPase